MANLSTNKQTRIITLYYRINGSQHAITLGKIDRRSAKSILTYVSDLVASKSSGTSCQPETSTWVGKIDDKLHSKLLKKGLVQARAKTENPTIGTFINNYLAMELGRGIGPTFAQSGEFDFLFFKDEPPPISSDGKFMNPPSKDDAAAADVLWWDWKPPVNPGVKSGELSRFWLGIYVPREMFVDGMATFTLRQHATIPEPAAILLLAIGLTAVASTAGRRR